MSSISTKSLNASSSEDDNINNNELRRGPWNVEEDTFLTHYIACHGEGRWNLLAKRSGLKRTGKSCRLRWLNYLKPDVKRGNLTPEEQLLILNLHSKWGNRWSKIAQYLPGRTDNEIKNYWRTRVQKQAKLLKIDPQSAAFQDIIRRFWMPRLIQKIEGSSPSTALSPPIIGQSQTTPAPIDNNPQARALNPTDSESSMNVTSCASQPSEYPTSHNFHQQQTVNNNSGFLEGYDMDVLGFFSHTHTGVSEPLENHAGGFHVAGGDWPNSDFFANLWTVDELWQHSI